MFESQAAGSMSARDFVERELRANPDISYAEVQERASRIGLNVQRFLYGSTRRSLGLPPRPEPAESAGEPAPRPQLVVAEQPAHGLRAATTPAPRLAPATEAADEDLALAAVDEDEVADAAVHEPPTAPGATIATPAAATPGGQKSSAFQFAVEALRMSPEMSFQDLKARASMSGLAMQPIVFGRAKALLGLVPTRPRRPKVEAPRLLRQVESAQQVDRLPGLDGIRSVEQLVILVRALEGERIKLRTALTAIQDAVTEALTD